MSDFAATLLRWQRSHGRRDLPWQGTRDAYRVWLSEVMLQQTQVTTVIGYYTRFLQRFPDVHALAAADIDAVLPLWAGLGYYARARNLHACARVVVARHDGQFPRSAAALAALPGIGRSTAAAIASFCFDQREAILDGNVKRVLARQFGVEGFPGRAAVERRLWALAQELLPASPDMPNYTQALMDLGATLCTPRQPRCGQCPVASGCVARRQQRVEQLPTPRPPRSLRLRRVWWLMAQAQAQVWLVQRPPAGLWGGLWVPPEFDDEAAARRAAAVWCAGSDCRLRAWPSRRHAFTHYTLEYTPLLVELPRRPLAAQEAGGQWCALAGFAPDRASVEPPLAVPAPVRAALAELAELAGLPSPPPTSAPHAASGTA
jgi:A/G-specific adenine glycosylase